MLPDLDAGAFGRWPNFTRAELACRHTGECRIHPDFMDRLQALRRAFGRPMRVTSGYRHPTHPAEAGKARPGAHSLGRAADIQVEGEDAVRLMSLAYQLGFTGIGVQQKGHGRYIHLDDVPTGRADIPRFALWSY